MRKRQKKEVFRIRSRAFIYGFLNAFIALLLLLFNGFLKSLI